MLSLTHPGFILPKAGLPVKVTGIGQDDGALIVESVQLDATGLELLPQHMSRKQHRVDDRHGRLEVQAAEKSTRIANGDWGSCRVAVRMLPVYLRVRGPDA